MIKKSHFAGLHLAGVLAVLGAAAALSSPAIAQQSDESVETLPPKVLTAKQAAKRDLRGLRVARAGSLAFASYDADGSMTITEEEIRRGAERSFLVADVNGDGAMSIFEQQDWAAAVGAHDGALANSTTFDANFDRRVTVAEFSDGMVRLSRAYADPETGLLRFADLLEAPAGADRPGSTLYEKPNTDETDKVEHSGLVSDR